MQIGGATNVSGFSAVNSYAQAQATGIVNDAVQGRLQATAPVQTQAAVRQADNTKNTSIDVKQGERANPSTEGLARDGQPPRPGSLLNLRV